MSTPKPKYDPDCLSQCQGVCQIQTPKTGKGEPLQSQFCGAIDTATGKYHVGIPTYALCRSTSGDWNKNKIPCKSLPIFNSGVCVNTCPANKDKKACTDSGCGWVEFGEICQVPENDPCQVILSKGNCTSAENCNWTTWPNLSPMDGEKIGTTSQAKFGPDPVPTNPIGCFEYCKEHPAGV